ncbi:hypothetical protein C8039_01375 [Halogeometricum sp. wsp3]|nr:hypothetical protein C8039_01375 [Halogeometricum sp. wsp3]
MSTQEDPPAEPDREDDEFATLFDELRSSNSSSTPKTSDGRSGMQRVRPPIHRTTSLRPLVGSSGVRGNGASAEALLAREFETVCGQSEPSLVDRRCHRPAPAVSRRDSEHRNRAVISVRKSRPTL